MQWRWNSSLFHQHTSQRVPIETEFCPWPFNHVLVIQPASDNHTPLRGRLHGYGYEAQPLDERTQCLVQWLVELLWVVIKPLNNLCPSETLLTSISHDWTLLPLLPFCVCFFLLFFLFRLILFQCIKTQRSIENIYWFWYLGKYVLWLCCTLS